jgi:glutaminase
LNRLAEATVSSMSVATERPDADRVLPRVLDAIRRDVSVRRDYGRLASYIAPLGRIDLRKFGIAVAMHDGRVIVVGDADEPFSIQSISKVFALTLALGKVGDALWSRVGREPSGNRFNSIVQLEHENGIPRNPFINAGAIVICDILLAGHEPKEAIGETLRFHRIHFIGSATRSIAEPGNEGHPGLTQKAVRAHQQGRVGELHGRQVTADHGQID